MQSIRQIVESINRQTVYECGKCRATMTTLGKGKPTGCKRCLAPASAIDFYRATPRAA